MTRGPTSGREQPRFVSFLFILSVVAALLPIAVATWRAVERGWLPVGDNAYFAIRARDVLTDHHPLLGTWTSASVTVGEDINNPGPLLFDLLAVPARLFDGGAGLAVAVAFLNGLSVVGIALFARRRGGPVVATASVAAAAGLAWAMGSELLYEPWQPHSLLLPFLFFLVLVWSVACGDVAAMPIAVGLGSLLLQTHLSFGVLVPALGAWAVVGFALTLRERRRDRRAWPELRRRAARASALSGLVLATCWAQSVAEQLSRSEGGNLARLASSLGDASSHSIGYGLGTRIGASVLALPPWWLRPSFEETLPSAAFDPGVPSRGLAAGSLALMTAVLATCFWDARRRRDREVSTIVVTGAVAVTAGLVTAAQASASVFGIPPPHQLRWLWPIGVFVFLAVAVALVRRLESTGVPTILPLGLLALAALLLGALNVPASHPSPTTPEGSIAVANALNREMNLDGEGSLLVDIREDLGDPYGVATLAELQRRGVEFVLDDPIAVRQLGSSRQYSGRNARATLFLRVGDDADVAPAGARPVARVEGLPAGERRELLDLESRIGEFLRREGLRLNQAGRAAREAGLLPDLGSESEAQALDPDALLRSGGLAAIVRADLLVLDDEWAPRFDRYAALHERREDRTVALFLAPRRAGGRSAALST